MSKKEPITSLRDYLIDKEQEKLTNELVEKNIKRYSMIEHCIKQCQEEMYKKLGNSVCNLRSEVHDNKLYLYYNILDVEFRTEYDLDSAYKEYHNKKKNIHISRCDVGIKCSRCKFRYAWEDDTSINWFGDNNRVEVRFLREKLSDSKKRYCKNCKVFVEQEKNKEENNNDM